MRGILNGANSSLMCRRITPAHAGNTFVFAFSWGLIWDHPRACGEYHENCTECLNQGGSPPRMRGIPILCGGLPSASGITPAHAGNTDVCFDFIQFSQDHPRACGEYTKKSHDIAVHLARNPNFYLVSKFTRMES